MVSKYISEAEMTATNKPFPNAPDKKQFINIKNLCIMVLDPIREHFNAPITCSSIFRSNEVNNAVGGVKTSHHLANNGYAAADKE